MRAVGVYGSHQLWERVNLAGYLYTLLCLITERTLAYFEGYMCVLNVTLIMEWLVKVYRSHCGVVLRAVADTWDIEDI